MITLKANKREKKEKNKELIPAVLYGPKIKNVSISINLKDFENVYLEAKENTLINILLDKEKYLVLIHDVSLNRITNRPIHVDFYQPILNKEVEAEVSLVFIGESDAVKNLGGTLIKEMKEVEVRALPQELPHQIEVDVSVLTDFDKEITIKDLSVGKGVKILGEEDEIVVKVFAPQDIEKDLEKPIEEKVDEVEKVEKEEDKEEESNEKSN